jgi:uncharacterized protein
MTTSRVATLAQSAVAGYLIPKLAADAKLDLTSAFAGITAKNYVDKRPELIANITSATTDLLAQDATLAELTQVLAAFDKRRDDEEDLPRPGGKFGKGPGDKKRRGMDVLPGHVKEHMKKRMSASDWKAVEDAMADAEDAMMDAEDESEEERLRKEKMRKEKMRKEKMEEEAHDRGHHEEDDEEERRAEDIKTAADAAIKEERKRLMGVANALKFVRPWVGELELAMDSDEAITAEDVYERALKMRGVKTDGIHPSAFKKLLEFAPKPGAARTNSFKLATDAMPDAASFERMFPDAMKIGVNRH